MNPPLALPNGWQGWSPRAKALLAAASENAATGPLTAPPDAVQQLAWMVALLPSHRLRRLAMHVGALAFAGHVRRLLDAQRALACRRALGEELHQFIMTGSTLLGPLPVWDGARGADAALPARVLSAGAAALLADCHACAPHLQRRLEVGLGTFDPWHGEIRGVDLSPLIRRVLRTVEPQWYGRLAKAGVAA